MNSLSLIYNNFTKMGKNGIEIMVVIKNNLFIYLIFPWTLFFNFI